MSDPVKIGSDEFASTLAEAAEKFGDGRKWPTDQHGRLRFCVRCEELRPHLEKDVPGWLPPMAHTWISPETGRRVWSTRCRACLKYEFEEMQKREQAAKHAEEVLAQAPQTGMRNRTNGGRKWPWQT